MFGPQRTPVRGTPYYEHDLGEFLKAHGLDPDAPKAPPPDDVERVFAVSQKRHFIARLAKIPRHKAVDLQTGIDPWTASCPPGRLFIGGFEPDRAVSLFRLERTGPRGQRASQGDEYLPGRLWHLRLHKVCLVIQDYEIVGRETAVTRIGEEDQVAVFQLLEQPIVFGFAPEEWQALQKDAGIFQDTRLWKAIRLVCPGSQVRRDGRDRALFRKTGSMMRAPNDFEDWINELEAAEAELLPPRSAKPKKAREPAAEPLQTAREIFAEKPGDDFLAGITKD